MYKITDKKTRETTHMLIQKYMMNNTGKLLNWSDLFLLCYFILKWDSILFE